MKMGITLSLVVVVLLQIEFTLAFITPIPQTVNMMCRSTTELIISSTLNSTPMTTTDSIEDNSILSNHLSSMTVLELKDLLRHQGLKVSGNKADLIERLIMGKRSDEKENIDTNNEEDVDLHSKKKKKKEIKKRTKEEKIKQMASIVKKKRIALTDQEGIPSPSLNRQVSMAVESMEEEAGANNSKCDTKIAMSDVDSGSFSDIEGLPDSLISRLNEIGIIKPTPIQRDAIPVALQGKDILGTAQTG